MEEGTSLNIVYLPDEKTSHKAIELSQKVSSELATEFILGQGTIPHITIYQARFPIKNVEKLKEIIEKIAFQTEPFEIEMSEFYVDVVRGFVGWNCNKTNQLIRVHEETLEKINPLREGLIPKGLKNFSGPEESKKDIKNYGSLLVAEHYPPHITITRLKNPQDNRKALEILGNQTSSFTADKISLGYLGDHGTVTGIIEEFPLLS